MIIILILLLIIIIIITSKIVKINVRQINKIIHIQKLPIFLNAKYEL